MVHRCCISSCGMNVRVAEAKGLSYHKFPTKEAIKDQWVQAIIPHLDKPESFKVVPRYSRVCSRHFRKKDYCMDAKKRARLNSNAVPSVFPRKTTPVTVQSVLPNSPKSVHPKTPPATETVPGSEVSSSSTSTSAEKVPTTRNCIRADGSCIIKLNDDCGSMVEILDADYPLNGIVVRDDLEIESATIQDDHLVLTMVDPAFRPNVESVSSSMATSSTDDQPMSTQSTEVKVKTEGDAAGGTKRRKRRKWNRTAFARPAKGKRKSLGEKPEPNVDQEEEEDEEDPLGGTDLSLSLDQPSQDEAEENESLQNVTLLLSDLPDQQQYQGTSVEQELLQSIQAVSLSCVGEDGNELHHTDDLLHFNNLQLVPAFLHHHSSEESLFSNESQSHPIANPVDDPLAATQPPSASNEDDSLRFELVDLRIDPDMPPVHPPTYLDIDELAHQLNSSLFTDGSIPLFHHDSLHLTAADLPGFNLEEHLVTTETESAAKLVKEKKPSAKSSKTDEPDEKEKGNRKAKNPRKAKTVDEVKKSPEKKLKGVTKRPKKDKISGKFSVERFKNSDKDIEYYTGFNSYRNFEAFFRSLEAYIERLCITDATYGITNLPSTPDRSTGLVAPGAVATTSTSSSSNVEQPKKRSCQGRSMSRINELFMTIIRLRRKLPEKVLGHMFFISQPTVSRVVRAWTVLLSKIIDSYPPETPFVLSSAYTEHNYPSKGLGIPNAFRELFHSDLAKSIVVTSLNPKKMKSKAITSKSKASKSKSKDD